MLKLQLKTCLKALEFCKVLFKLFSIPQTLRTNTAKRQILSSAQLVIVAIATGKIFATACAALKKNHFTAQDAADRFHEVFDVVVAFNGEEALVTVII